MSERLAVEFIIDLLAQGWSNEEVLRNYPGITLADLQACLSYLKHLHSQSPVPSQKKITPSLRNPA